MTRRDYDRNRDPELEQAFAALREREREGGPRFARLWAAAAAAAGRGHGSRTGRFAFAAAGAAAALIALWLVRPPAAAPPRHRGAVPSISEWRPATDFLLRTPGRELLGEPPALGGGWLAPSFPSTSTTLKERRSS